MKRFLKGIEIPDYKRRILGTYRIFQIESPRFVSIPIPRVQHLASSHSASTPSPCSLSPTSAEGRIRPTMFGGGGEGRVRGLRVCVREGERVLVGTRLCESENREAEAVPVHSSVSGIVRSVTDDWIRIESDRLDSMGFSAEPRLEIPSDPDFIIESIREAGVMDLSGHTNFFARQRWRGVHRRLLESWLRGGIETLILNGCESEPFLTCDHLLMMNDAAEILKGAELMRLAAQAREAVIAVGSDKREALEVLNSKNYQLRFSRIRIEILSAKYPQDDTQVLAETVCGKILPWGEDPLSKGILVQNVATAFAVYEAVYLKKPFYERVVTVGGPCVVEPKNVWARVGTSAVDLIRAAKGLLRDPDRVIFGGPMRGRAIQDLEEPLTPEVQGVLALPPEIVSRGEEEPCIHCGKCVDACPEGLWPESLVWMIRGGRFDLAARFGLQGCAECAACSYVCPSYIPIASIIKYGKSKLPCFEETPAVPNIPAHQTASPPRRGRGVLPAKIRGGFVRTGSPKSCGEQYAPTFGE